MYHIITWDLRQNVIEIGLHVHIFFVALKCLERVWGGMWTTCEKCEQGSVWTIIKLILYGDAKDFTCYANFRQTGAMKLWADAKRKKIWQGFPLGKAYYSSPTLIFLSANLTFARKNQINLE